MRSLQIGVACLATIVGSQAAGSAVVVLDNAQFRVFRTPDGSRAGVDHAGGVVVPLDHPDRTAWADDAATPSDGADGPLVIVEPKHVGAPAPAATGSNPGDAPFVGMSFKTLFAHENVSALRARMEVGAREGFHTHGSDTVVVHLSGGEIEDTANGVTKVNRWKHGDVEFEARGSSHSARNVGRAIDVVLVALGPSR
ncbi:MAG: hypothetical protein ACM3SQ_01595 [Betaproteobacteria bacterium]